MSKFLPLGLDLTEVIRATTETPAKALQRPELGTLRVGAVGDASVLSVRTGAFELEDVLGETVTSDRRIFAEGCVIGGKWFERPQSG